MDKHDIPIIGDFYTKAEVDAMVAAALDEARAIDAVSYTHLTLQTNREV